MKICFYALREYDELQFCEQFSKEMGIDFVWTADYPTFENVSLADGCDAASMPPCYMAADMIEAFHKVGVKYIACRSIGYDHVDIAKAHELGMRVSNVCYPPDGVANYAIMLMMMCGRKISHIMKRSEVQDYSLKGKIGLDLSTCTVGVLGTGQIGTTVLRNLSMFGCRLLAYDPYQNEKAASYATYTDPDTLFAESDIITLHMNATEENYHMICRESLAKMKDGVIIVNTARGKLIDSEALIEALESGKVGGAGLDVLENENGLYYYNRMGDDLPIHDMAILRSFPNVILSPHTAFYTLNNVSHMVRGVFESVQAFAEGKETFHEVK